MMRVRRRKHIALHRGPAPVPAGPTERWSMDFVHDALADGRQFRVLTVVDQWSRQSPILEVASSLSGVTVGVALDRVLPQAHALRFDHGTEFMSRALEDWAHQRGVQLDFPVSQFSDTPPKPHRDTDPRCEVVVSAYAASDNGTVVLKEMTWQARAQLVVGALFVLLVLGYLADSPRRHQRNEDVRRVLNAKAQALKAEIDRSFPVGTSQADIIEFLRKQPTQWRDETDDGYWLSIGSGPSGVWYCGSMDVGIRATFERGRLITTEVGTWSLDCL